MTKTMLFTVAAALATFAAMPAAADVYGQANVGYSVSSSADVDATIDEGDGPVSGSGEVDLENGYLFSGALGTAMDTGLRVEGEILYSTNDLEDELFGDAEVSQWALMANVLYDFPVGGFNPYVGAGVGYGSINLDVGDDDFVDDSGVTWQIRAGVGFAAGERVTWDVGYRYLNLADLEVEGESDGIAATLDADGEVHAITVGVRYNFGS